MQIRRFILTLALGLCAHVHASTLVKLESILAPFPSLQSFLESPEAVLEYRDALKDYMGEGASFDPVYAEFIRQIKEVDAKIPKFGEQAWAVNSKWQEQIFTIRGEHTGTGLEIKREAVLDAIEELKKRTAAEAPTDVAELVTELQKIFRILPASETAKLSHAQFKEYQKQIGSFVDHPAAKKLAAYVAHQRLSKDESLGDELGSGDADIIVRALKNLRRVGEVSPEFKAFEKQIPSEWFGYLRFQSPNLESLLSAYEGGQQSMKEFRRLADTRLPTDLLPEFLAWRGEGLNRFEMSRKFQGEKKAKFDKWLQDSAQIRERKARLVEKYNSDPANRYFKYALHEDKERGTVRLKSDTATELKLIPTPRPFHAFFAGRKTGECVGGRDCESLVPKRWARAALNGAESLFTETGDEKMEGMVGLTPLMLRTSQERAKPIYQVVDLMSRAIKGDVVLKDARGKPIKYSLFDIFVDRYPRPAHSAGLVISDGNNVSQNIQGGEVVLHSPAYLENHILGKPEDFAPSDPLAESIAKEFPQTLNDYGQGGMIYDGMKGDGRNVFRLVPVSERRKWTQDELEFDLIAKMLWDRMQAWDLDVIWKRAKESGIRLDSLGNYERKIEEGKFPGLSQILKRDVVEFLAGPSLEHQKLFRAESYLRAINRFAYTDAMVPADAITAVKEFYRLYHRGIARPIGAVRILFEELLKRNPGSEVVQSLFRDIIIRPFSAQPKDELIIDYIGRVNFSVPGIRGLIGMAMEQGDSSQKKAVVYGVLNFAKTALLHDALLLSEFMDLVKESGNNAVFANSLLYIHLTKAERFQILDELARTKNLDLAQTLVDRFRGDPSALDEETESKFAATLVAAKPLPKRSLMVRCLDKIRRLFER